MSFTFFLDPPPRPQCLFCGCNRQHHGAGGPLDEDDGDAELRVDATYNHSVPISEALNYRVDGELQHYRDWIQGKSGKEIIPVFRKVVRKLEAGPNKVTCNGMGSRPSDLADQILIHSFRRPNGVWRWEH